jgi:hypothetical protein
MRSPREAFRLETQGSPISAPFLMEVRRLQTLLDRVLEVDSLQELRLG